MSQLVIEGLRAAVDGQEILKGVDLVVGSGEVHAVMGPNGSGKSTLSHVIAGRPGYEVLGGSVRIDDVELLDLPAWRRAEAGLFLAMQYPTEVPGVSLRDLLFESTRTPTDRDEIESRMRAEAERIGFDERFLERPLNVDLSGGEKKRNETLQMGVLRPAFAILDELDSGLDVDALRLVSQRVEEATKENGVGVLAITHYSRLFQQLQPDVVHVFAGGRVQESGGPGLATELEDTGYERWVGVEQGVAAGGGTADADPFADPLA
jgi:Fe-S cluster assembly ATP-binding protein